MQFRILGPVEVWRDGEHLPVAGPKQRALLAILLVHRNRVVAAERLIELLWGDDSPDTASHSLQVHVSQLRKLLPANTLDSRPPGYVLRAADDEVDASQFETRVVQASQLRQAGDLDGAVRTLREALSLWRGEPLADVATAPYAIAEVARLTELRLRAIEERLEAELALGHHADLLAELEALVAQHPLRERLCAHLMLALYRSGRQAEASDLYYRTRKQLVEELGMEPGVKLQSLLKEILRQESSLELPAALEVRPPARPVRRALCPIVVGRERELRLLNEAMRTTSATRTQLILLAGEAGVGKTRLAEELQKSAIEARMQIMWGGCSESELAIPYLPIVEAVGNYLATIELPRLKKLLGPMARELGHLFPQLAGDDPALDGSDPRQARLRLFESILALLRLASEPGHLLLVVEDIHWADASTREFLDYLVRRLPQVRATVLLTYRRDELRHNHPLLPHVQRWERSGLATSVELQPLTAEGVAGIVSAIFDRGTVTAEFRDYLQARTEGNPFVVEEMLKGAIDRGEIYRTDVGWERKALAELRIPPTIREVILQRLARLDPYQADVVRTAAVLGESFSYEALLATSLATEPAVREALRECVQQQLMEAESDHRFRFRHALTRQAIYEDLLGPERAARHFQAAAALRLVPGAPSAEIATHLVLAGKWDEAVPELIRAAEEAEGRRGYHEAADLYERVLPHVADRVIHARLLCRQAYAYYLGGEPARAQPLLERGIPILEQAGNGNEAASHRLTLGSCHWLAGQFDQAKADYEGIRANLEANGPNETLARAYIQLALLALNAHDVEEGLRMADQAIQTAEAIGASGPRIWSHIYRGIALVERGSVEAGLHDLDRSWHEAIEGGLFDVAGIALSNAIYQRSLSFRASQSGPLFERLMTLPDLVHAGGRLAIWICLRRALTDIVLGEMPTAHAAAVEGLRLAQQSAVMLIPEFTSFAAVAACALGRADEARRLVPQLSVPLSAANAEPAWMAMRVWLDLGETERAVELASGAMNYLQHFSRPLGRGVWLIDKAVEVFLAAKMPREAERLRLQAEAAPSVGQPLIDRIEGRVALFRGDLLRADEYLSSAVLLFHDTSYRDDEWRTRRALAEVKIRRGERAAGEHELRLVIAGADAHGHVFEAAAARRQLQDLELSLTLTKPRVRH